LTNQASQSRSSNIDCMCDPNFRAVFPCPEKYMAPSTSESCGYPASYAAVRLALASAEGTPAKPQKLFSEHPAAGRFGCSGRNVRRP